MWKDVEEVIQTQRSSLFKLEQDMEAVRPFESDHSSPQGQCWIWATAGMLLKLVKAERKPCKPCIKTSQPIRPEIDSVIE